MTTGREAIVWLLVRRVRALSLLAWIERRTVDASVILHYLGKPECVMAMKGANEYLGAARTQMDRIEPAMRAWYDVTDRSRVFHEIHYYFICWDAIWKRLMVIKKRSGLRSVRPILQKHHVEAEHYAFGRDQLSTTMSGWKDARDTVRSPRGTPATSTARTTRWPAGAGMSRARACSGSRISCAKSLTRSCERARPS
jgi:hypothetical protein